MNKPTNVFTGTVTKVVRGATNEIVTVQLDHVETIELTVSFTPVPEAGQTATGAEAAHATPAGAGTAGCTQEGSKVKVVLPVPNAFIVHGS